MRTEGRYVESLGQIDWTVVTTLRFFSAIVMAVCALQLILFLSHYYHAVIPMRREMPDVLAPPIVITFIYHFLVMGMFLSRAVSRIQVVLWKHPPPATLETWTAPVMSVVMVYVIYLFQRYYTQRLRDEQFRRG